MRLPVTPAARAQAFWHGIRRLLADRRWLVFLLVSFISGAGLAVLTNFLFLYLEELNASRTVMGLSLTIATISELPVLFYSSWMLRRWGTRGVLVLSLVLYIIRMFAMSAATGAWQVLLLQLLHGLTFSAMWVASVSYANEIAPPGLGATAQGLFNSTVFGLGGITGALIGGLLLDRYGGAAMFFWSGVAMLAGLIVFLAFSRDR